MKGRRFALAAAGLVVLLVASAAAAAPAPRVLFTLPSTRTPIGLEPPLTGVVSFEHEVAPLIFRQQVDSQEHVQVGVDASGTPNSVAVVQRLLISGKGDYLYTVPGPVLGVSPTADTQSQPGFRTGAIVWAGFSPGSRRLGVRARLGVHAAAPYLPLRVSVASSVDGRPLREGEERSGKLVVRVTLRNATQAKTPIATAAGDALTLARTLDAARRGDFPAASLGISVRTPVLTRQATVEAPLVVTGNVVLHGRSGEQRHAFSVELGDGLPLTRTLTFAAQAVDARTPDVTLKVEPVNPHRTLAPPNGARSWVDYARRTGAGDSRELLVAVEDAFLRAARANQYDTYLKNPTLTVGKSVGDYTYVTVAPRAVARATSSHGGLGALAVALIALGAVVAAGGLVVWWAHS